MKDEQELARILRRVWKIKDRETAFRKQAEKANAGDLDSLKFLALYAYGKPAETIRQEITAAPVLSLKWSETDEEPEE